MVACQLRRLTLFLHQAESCFRRQSTTLLAHSLEIIPSPPFDDVISSVCLAFGVPLFLRTLLLEYYRSARAKLPLFLYSDSDYYLTQAPTCRSSFFIAVVFRSQHFELVRCQITGRSMSDQFQCHLVEVSGISTSVLSNMAHSQATTSTVPIAALRALLGNGKIEVKGLVGVIEKETATHKHAYTAYDHLVSSVEMVAAMRNTLHYFYVGFLTDGLESKALQNWRSWSPAMAIHVVLRFDGGDVTRRFKHAANIKSFQGNRVYVYWPEDLKPAEGESFDECSRPDLVSHKEAGLMLSEQYETTSRRRRVPRRA